MPVPTVEVALTDLQNFTQGAAGGMTVGLPRRVAILHAAVEVANSKLQRDSTASLETAMDAFTDASNKGSDALTRATNKLVMATWVLAGVAAVQALVMFLAE